MTSIVFNEVSLDLPIYNARSRSLKNRMIQAATGGHILSARDGSVIVRALDNISFQLNDGDRLGILGHNGAGKSTLLRMLCGVYSPTVGSIKIKGKISSLIDISLGTDLEATGRDNIYLRGCLLGMSKTAIQTNIEEIIDDKIIVQKVMPSYDYLTEMSLKTLTIEKKTALEKQENNIKMKIEELQNKGIASIWLDELKEVENAWNNFKTEIESVYTNDKKSSESSEASSSKTKKRTKK